MYGEKKFIERKYADTILQLAWKFKHENPDMKNTPAYSAMDRTLETMDKYVAYINNMGFMMYEISIFHMAEYIGQLTGKECGFSSDELN